MTNIIIRPNKNVLYQISKEDIEELRYIPEEWAPGFSHITNIETGATTTPYFHQKEEWYVILKNGKKIYLTKKQYSTIKGWFKGE